GDQEGALGGKARIPIAVHPTRRLGRKDDTRSQGNRVSLDPHEHPPLYSVLGVTLLNHRITEISDPGNAAPTMQRQSNEMRRGDRIGRPDDIRAMAADEPEPRGDGAE